MPGKWGKPYRLRIAERSPRSSGAKTSGRPSEKIRNIWAVQRPMPLTSMSDLMISSSFIREKRCQGIVPSTDFRARSSR